MSLYLYGSSPRRYFTAAASLYVVPQSRPLGLGLVSHFRDTANVGLLEYYVNPTPITLPRRGHRFALWQTQLCPDFDICLDGAGEHIIDRCGNHIELVFANAL
jgi:hypothetical protein